MENKQFDSLKEGIDSLVSEVAKPQKTTQSRDYSNFNNFSDVEKNAYKKVDEWRTTNRDWKTIPDQERIDVYNALKGIDRNNMHMLPEGTEWETWYDIDANDKYLNRAEIDSYWDKNDTGVTYSKSHTKLNPKDTYNIEPRYLNVLYEKLPYNEYEKYPKQENFNSLDEAKEYYKKLETYAKDFENKKNQEHKMANANNKKVTNEYNQIKDTNSALAFMKNNIDEYFNDDNNDELYDDTYDEYGGGYNGHSMSNRAVNAYEHGLAPLSKWDRDRLLSVVDDYSPDSLYPLIPLLEKLTTSEIRKNLLEPVSWHHTGKFYNPTTFYGLKKPKEIIQYLLKKYGMEK